MDRGAWTEAVHGVTESDTTEQQSMHLLTYTSKSEWTRTPRGGGTGGTGGGICDLDFPQV